MPQRNGLDRRETAANSPNQVSALALKVIAVEQGLEAQRVRIDERTHVVEVNAASTAQLLETKLSAVDKTLQVSVETVSEALKLQAREYERRFGLLDKGLDKSVSIEVFNEVERQHRDDGHSLRAWRDKVDAELNVQRGKNSERQSMIALALSVLALLATIVGLFLAYGHRVI